MTMPSSMASVAAAVQQISLAHYAFSSVLNPGIFLMDVGISPRVVNCGFFIFELFAMASYSLGWLYFL
jgi:hypothetical protein